MSALKNELLSVLPKVIDAKTYLSNMDQIFMILTLIKLGVEFDITETPVMLTPSHPRSDSWSIRGGHQGRGQRPHCTYYNRLDCI